MVGDEQRLEQRPEGVHPRFGGPDVPMDGDGSSVGLRRTEDEVAVAGQVTFGDEGDQLARPVIDNSNDYPQPVTGGAAPTAADAGAGADLVIKRLDRFQARPPLGPGFVVQQDIGHGLARRGDAPMADEAVRSFWHMLQCNKPGS